MTASATPPVTQPRWKRLFNSGQEQLIRHLEKAAALSNTAAHTIDRPQLQPGQLPSYTLVRLHMEARLQFGSGLRLLQDAWLSYGVDSHVRMLLEAVAHTAWLCGFGEAPERLSPACRAICLELGWLRERKFNALKLTRTSPDDIEADLEKRSVEELEQMEALRAQYECKCKARRAGQVAGTLEAVAKQEGYPRWYPHLYDLYCQATHLQTPERFTRSQGEDRVFFPATFSQRAYSLTWLLVTYGKIAEWVLAATGSDKEAHSVDRAVGRVIHSRWMDRARDGWVDHRMGYRAPTFPPSYHRHA